MVDSKGYVHLIDMGTAKILKEEKNPGKFFIDLNTNFISFLIIIHTNLFNNLH